MRRTEYVIRTGHTEDEACVDGNRNKRQADKLIKEAMVNPNVESTAWGYLISIYHLTDWGDNEELYWVHPLLKENEDGEYEIIPEE